MIAVLRFAGNVLLSVVVVILVLAILMVGYGAVMVSVWENANLEDGVAGGAWADIDGRSIYYQDVGPIEGTTVLLVHGLGVEGLQVWGDSATALSRSGLRVIAADLPGFGYSEREGVNGADVRDQADVLSELLDNLDVEQVTVVGHGWGGSVALRLAKDRPDVVRQMVLVAPWLAKKPTIWPTLLKVPYVSRGATWVAASGGPLWELVRRLGFENAGALDSDLLAAMRRPTHVRGTVDALLAAFRAWPESLANADVSEVRIPVLIVAGDKDRYVSLGDIEKFTKRFPNASLMTIEEAGHYVHIEQSLAVSRDVAEFCLESNP